MTREVLSNGVIVPEKYTRDWFDDFRTNLVKLNDAITAIAGKQNALTQEQLDAVNSAITSQKVTAYDDHIADTSKHLTDGTAPKAIGDEDGTSIKTGYVNVAGIQTVSGQKMWSGVNYFNNKNLYQTDANPQYAFKSSTLEIGVQPSGHCTATVAWLDNNDVELGYSRFVEYNNSIQTYEVLLKNKAENGSLSPAGNDISASLQLALFKTGGSQLNLGVDTVVPTSNNNVSLGSSSYQWSSVYAQTYYYNGTAWGLNQNNTWTGINTFSSTIYSKIDATTLASYKDIYQCQNDSGDRVVTLRVTHSNSARVLSINVHDNSNSAPKGIVISNDGNNNISLTGGGTSNDLGTSTNKWKTFNGVNPGALSFPSSSYVDISGDITVRDGSAANFLTASCDGWVSIGSFATWVQIADDTTRIAVSGKPVDDGYAQVFLPVRQGDSIKIIINQTSTTFQAFRLIPCQGNV